MYWYADIVGTALDWRRRLRVVIVWGKSLSHRRIWNVLSMPASTALKWVFNVWIACSARFCLWLFGGSSWIVQFFCISFLYSADASLSIMCVFGLTVLFAVRRSHEMSKLWSLLLLFCFSWVLHRYNFRQSQQIPLYICFPCLMVPGSVQVGWGTWCCLRWWCVWKGLWVLVSLLLSSWLRLGWWCCLKSQCEFRGLGLVHHPVEILSWLIILSDVVVSCVLFVLHWILGSVYLLFWGWVLAMLHSFLRLLLASMCFQLGILRLHASIFCFVWSKVSCKCCWFHFFLLMLL